MKKVIKIAGQMLLFLIILITVFGALSKILQKKYVYSQDSAAMEIMKGFYAESDNSLDVLYLGSSYVRNGISPLQIWKNYGYTGYSRASSQQSPLVSYYLLEETLKTQSPKVVFFEATTIIGTETSEANDYDVKEEKIHEIIDFMPASRIKYNLAKEISENSNVAMADLLVPLYRYHDRWEEIGENDFGYSNKAEHYPYKGHYPSLAITATNYEDDYMVEGGWEEEAWIDDTTSQIVDRMIKLCEENGAKLVLVKIPNAFWDDNKSDLLTQYAKEKGIDYIDFCTEDIRTEIGFDELNHFSDAGLHCNIDGARVVSNYIGQYLHENFELEDKRNNEAFEAWNQDLEKYELECNAMDIKFTTNLVDFLDLLQNKNYAVFVTGRSDISTYFSEEIYDRMKALGFETDLSDKPYYSYLGVSINGEKEYEACGPEILDYEFQLENGTWVSLLSDTKKGSSCNVSICIGNEEQVTQTNGLKVVVYDLELNRVVTSKSFRIGVGGTLYESTALRKVSGDMAKYIALLDNPDYYVAVYAQGNAGEMLTKDVIDAAKLIGLDISKIDETNKNYAAMIDAGKCIEQRYDFEPIELSKNVKDVSVNIVSDSTGGSFIKINDEKYDTKKEGFNFVVYDKVKEKVVSDVVFNTSENKYFLDGDYERDASFISYMDYAAKMGNITILTGNTRDVKNVSTFMRDYIKDMGITVDFYNRSGEKFVIVLQNGKCVNEVKDFMIAQLEMEVGGKSIKVQNYLDSVCLVDGVDYSENKTGINIVVLDSFNGDVISKNWFESLDEGYSSELLEMTDYEYLEYLSKSDYVVMMSIADDRGMQTAVSYSEILGKMWSGLEVMETGVYGMIFQNGKIINQQYDKSNIEFEKKISDISVGISAQNEPDNISSIKIDGREYIEQNNGINIVVYDEDTKRVVDVRNIDNVMPFESEEEKQKDKGIKSVGAITSFKASVQNNGDIRLAWNKVQNADAYQVFRKNITTNMFELIAVTSETEFYDRAPIENEVNYYLVYPYAYSLGEMKIDKSTKYTYVMPFLAEPEDVRVYIGENNRISWKEVAGAEGYMVYKMDNEGKAIKVGSTMYTSFTFDDVNDGEYYYVYAFTKEPNGEIILGCRSDYIRIQVK